MENSDFISLGALIVSGFAAYYTWEANKRAIKKEGVESKILLNVSCEFDDYNKNIVQVGGLIQVGQGIRFSLAIHNYGYRHAFIKNIYLMGSNQLAIQSIHEFSLTNNTERNIKSTDKVGLELWIPINKLRKLIEPSVKKTIFIRLIVEGDKYFDSNSTQVNLE